MDRPATPPKPPDATDLLRRAQVLADSTAPTTRAVAQNILRLSRENQGERR